MIKPGHFLVTCLRIFALPAFSMRAGVIFCFFAALQFSGCHSNPLGGGTAHQDPQLDTVLPTVSTVAVQTALTVDVTFSETMGAGVTTATNFLFQELQNI